ncbi:hypothetical protein AB0I81_35795 [Nonomuraea sp. NPDC050404]|uniref:trypsin-like serine peptidase n=1 Tax=Nonomuraea sp. NPDC050404 TaxID=3155783 RepID=UPI003406FB28
MRTFAVTGLTTLLLGLSAHAAVAEPAKDAPVEHKVASTLRAADDYWSAERMQAAEPLAAPEGTPADAPRTPFAAGEPVDIDPTPTITTKRYFPPYSTKAAKQATWKSGGLITKTAGKVFGTGGNGKDFVASGNVVNSKDGDVVVTVAHAMMDGEGRWSKNLVFVPAYKNGAAPYGKFAARTMFMWSGYYKDGAHVPPLDFGMLVVKPVKGKSIVKTVGGQGLRFNSAAGTSNLLLGYPSNGNGGKTLQYCSGASVSPSYGMKWAMKCDMGGGSSGGPWFHAFNKTTGTGYQISAHALRNTTTSYGAYFGPEALKTFQAAVAA